MNKILLALLALSIVVHIWVFVSGSHQITGVNNEKSFSHLAQRILVENPRDILVNFVPLRVRLRQFVQERFGSNLALYFEYLPTGTSIGVNEKTEFYPGSLLKVPTTMAYLHKKEKEAEKDDPDWSIEEKHINNTFGTLWQRGAGARVRASEAIRLAISESDNTAANMIFDHTTQEDFDFIYDGLDVSLTYPATSSGVFITTKEYSSIMKALYYASVLSKENSEFLLLLLTQTVFRSGLPAGVPEGIAVAHKIGVYENLDVPVYSDCGIVYVPKRPYLLCVAVKADKKTSEDAMRTISQMIYEFVSGWE